MSFDLLPTELVTKILEQLVDDASSYASLISTCRRLVAIHRTQTKSRIWPQHRPLKFRLDLAADKYQTRSRDDLRCEVEHGKSSLGNSAIDYDECFFSRFVCLMSAKQLIFSSIKCRDEFFHTCECLAPIRDLSHQNKRQIDSLIEISLHDCFVTVEWLDLLMTLLPNVRYLTIDGSRPGLLVRTHRAGNDHGARKTAAARTLLHLGMKKRMFGPISNYLLTNYPAEELDISEFIVPRSNWFYGYDRLDEYNPVNFIKPLSVLSYLIKNKAIVKHLTIRGIVDPELFVRKIEQDPDLKHIVIHDNPKP